jgi:Tol biopolymer transport system component
MRVVEIPGHLNHYRILGPIGEGGMGAVYAAEDTRLHRKVALKVLSTLMAADPERRERFEREAQAIAALNHPHIVTIYSVEEADGLPFLTMELVEGRPLSEAIPSGGMTPEKMLKIGVAVSDAIAAAHQRGITHRDLKPANVMLADDGRVKVLDFGLAKLRAEQALAPDDVTRLPASSTLTGEGRILGTVAYMSPEQAEGKPVDPRSDIFSLGVMLHEMGTGDRPFQGDTNVSIISAILKDTPSTITDLNPRLPTGLARIVRRCLAKDPSRRYQSATDLRNDLEELKQEVDSGATQTFVGQPAAARARSTSRLRSGGLRTGVIMGVLGLAFAGWLVVRSNHTAAPDAGAQPFSAERFTRLTTSGNASLAALSPDGRYVVHVKFDGDKSSLWIRQTATASETQIAQPSPDRYDGVTFSPDGNFVYYVTYGPTGAGVASLFKIPALGGVPTKVVEDIDGGVAFSPDGKRFAFVRGAPATGTAALIIANADGTQEKVVSAGKNDTRFQNEAPSWSPDGRTLLVSGQTLRGGPANVICAVNVNDGSVEQVGGRWGFTQNVQWLPDGRSFMMDGIAFDGISPQLYEVTYPSGERRRVTNDLNTYLGVNMSADGKAIATVQTTSQANLWITTPGKREEARRLTNGARSDGAAGVDWMPDGRLVFASTATGLPQIFIINADGTGQRQLSNSEGPATGPSVTPDGKWIFFNAAQRNGVTIWRVAPDGSGLQQMTHGRVDTAPVASPDGKWVYYTAQDSGQPRPLRIPVDGGEPVALGDVNFRTLSVYPDGSRLFGSAWNQAARNSQMATLPASGGAVTFVPGAPGGARLFRDGRQYLFIRPLARPVSVLSVPVDGGAPRELARAPVGQISYAVMSKTGELAIASGTVTTDVVLITAAEGTPKKD